MAKNIRDLVGTTQSRSFHDLVDKKLLGLEDYGYALKGTSRALPDFDPDPHNDRSNYYGESQRLTVSEFIRQTQPEWEHVAITEKRSQTGKFSGVPVVTLLDRRSYQEQIAEFDAQIAGLSDPSPPLNICNSKAVQYVKVEDD